MGAVGVVQMARDEVIDVVAVRHRFVSATSGVHVVLGMARAIVCRRAGCGVPGADFEHALVHVSVVGVVKVTIMQVVDMIAVANGRMAAIGAVNVLVIRVGIVAHDLFFPGTGDVAVGGSLACSNAARISWRTWSSASE